MALIRAYLRTILFSTLFIMLVMPAYAGKDIASLEKAFNDYREAVLKGDLDDVISRMSKASQKHVKAIPKKVIKNQLSLLQNIMRDSKTMKVTKQEIKGNDGYIHLHKKTAKTTSSGKIHLKYEDNRWALHNQNWKEADN